MESRLDRPSGVWLGRAVRVVLVVLGVAPVVTPFFAQLPGLRLVALPFETWFEFQCHRELGRSFDLFGVVMSVCSRCFGIYFGLGLGALVLRPRLDAWPLRIWVGRGAVVMLLDVATEGLAMRPPSGWVRVVTGLFLAYPVGAALVLAARGEQSEQ